MSLKIDEISAIIKQQIKQHKQSTELKEQGIIISVADSVVLIYGLDNALLGELLNFSDNTTGMVLSLEEDVVGAVLLDENPEIKEGDVVYRTGTVVEIGVGDALLGRIVNGLGQAIDSGPKLKIKKNRPIEAIAPGVMYRETVNEPLETGILSIDAMIPIGKGQRELIVGDRQTGKTAIAIDTIINQKGKNVNCVYVAIGQKNSSVAQIVQKLKEHDAMEYTTIVAATASKLAPQQYLAPYTGISIAEEWREQGKDVLIVYDDLSKHAVAYRTMSLLLRRPPGREAYPGDIFYLHSRLLERAVKINKKHGGGTITALPIIETQAEDISAYIPTNVISITDGQLFLVNDLFNSGQRPAVDSGISVSRVGSEAQIKGIKQVSRSLKLELAQYRELQAFSQFGSDLDKDTKIILEHGKRVLELLKQEQYKPLNQIDQILILLSAQERLIKWIPTELIGEYRDRMLTNFHKKGKAIWDEIDQTKALGDKVKAQALALLKKFTIDFTASIPNYNGDSYGDFAEFAKEN